MLETFAEQEFRDLLEFLTATPSQVRQLSRDFASDELKRKPSTDEFSFLENVCHLRDIEREGYTARISKLLNESNPTLPDIDGARLARERDYNSEDFETVLREFERLRENNVRILGSLGAESLSRSGMFEGVGTINLKTLAAMMREHDEAHRAELKGLRDWLSTAETGGQRSEASKNLTSNL
ncbi:MAG TPA: DinB family protein [Pyrinomonadaceae bacterium]|nr:DinB family protein [Pyrinomonadaceae bacterium]